MAIDVNLLSQARVSYRMSIENGERVSRIVLTWFRFIYRHCGTCNSITITISLSFHGVRKTGCTKNLTSSDCHSEASPLIWPPPLIIHAPKNSLLAERAAKYLFCDQFLDG